MVVEVDDVILLLLAVFCFLRFFRSLLLNRRLPFLRLLFLTLAASVASVAAAAAAGGGGSTVVSSAMVLHAVAFGRNSGAIQ